MKKHQLDLILRAAGEITGQKQFVIVGSQALQGAGGVRRSVRRLRLEPYRLPAASRRL
jgi:hypothetical protein